MKKEANVDFIANGQAKGAVANAIMANGSLDVGRMRPFVGEDGKAYITVFTGGDPKQPSNYVAQVVTNAVLRRDEWKKLDEVVMQISRERLGGIEDLTAAGLTYTLGNGMGTTILETHDISDAMEAVMTMDGLTRGQSDRPEFGTNYLPLPIIHVDYSINARVLEASRKLGNPLDTTSVEYATRKVMEKMESLLFSAPLYTYGGGTIYSYLNHPDRNPVSLTTAWDDGAMTGALIIADVLAMKQASITAMHYGPWMIYIPTAYETILDQDYDTTRGNTIRERILAIANIKGIKVIDELAADNVLLVQMTSDTIRLVKGMDIQNVQWGSEGNLVTDYKVMTIQVPQVRADQAGNSGVTHLA